MFRIHLLGPQGRLPRAIVIQIGREDDNRVYGFGIASPHFVSWRNRRWTEADEALAFARRERETLQRPW